MKDLTPSLSRLAHKLHPKLGELYDWNFTYWNFALVGGGGVLINWLVFLSLRSFVGDFAWWMGVLVAWNFNYLLNKVWVFNHAKKKEKTKK